MKTKNKDFLENIPKEEWNEIFKKNAGDWVKKQAYDFSELGKRENTSIFEIATQMRNIMKRKDLLGEEDKELFFYIDYLFMIYSRKMREIEKGEELKKEVAKYGWEAVMATKEKQLNKLLREHGDPALKD